MGIGPDTHSGRPTSQYQWDSCGKWLIVNGLAQSTGPCTFVGFEKISILRAVVGIGPDTHSGRPTSQYQWDSCGKWLIVNGLAQSTRPCTFVGFEKISILRASPASQLSWDIRTKSLTVTG